MMLSCQVELIELLGRATKDDKHSFNIIQKDLNAIVAWSGVRLINFNVYKCKGIQIISRNRKFAYRKTYLLFHPTVTLGKTLT